MTRITLLLVTFCLFASLASAYAECAWVLWTSYLSNRTEHAIDRTFESQRTCEQAIPERVQSHLKIWRPSYEEIGVSPVDPALVVAKGGRSPLLGDSLIVRVSCWPLGLQPTVSGGAEYPKGGGR